MRITFARTVAGAMALVLLTISQSAAEGSLDEAKTLYAEASFENALAVLGRLDAASSKSPDVLEYTALCLVALGRAEDARSVVDTLVSTSPAFVPTGEDVSPRFMTLLNESRRRLLSGSAKRLFNDARDQFHMRNYGLAKDQFEQVLRLADDGVWRESSDAADLRTLASGFVELVNTMTESTDAKRPRPGEAASVPTTPSQIIAVLPPARSTTELRQPVPVQQPMPKWRPTDAVTASRHFTGAVRIRIGTDGHVISATIEVPTDPNYDMQLLEAARTWVYRPATRNGEPIEVDKLVTYNLRMR
jgi:TonB family protein